MPTARAASAKRLPALDELRRSCYPDILTEFRKGTSGVKKTTIWNRGYTCAFFANLLLCFSQHSVNTLISTYAGYLGAGAVLVGTISGLYFGVAFAARPVSGPIITMLDKKKVILVTYALGVVTNIAYAYAGSIPLFIAARVLHGLQFAFVGSLNLTIASDSLPKEKLGSGIGLFGAGTALSMSIGPGMGIAVRDWGEAHWGGGQGYTAVFLMAALFMLLALLPCILLPSQRPSRAQREALGPWYANIVAKETLLPALLLSFVSLSSTLATTYLVPYAEVLGLESIGLYFTVYALVLLGARPVFGRISDRVGMNVVVLPTLLVYALSFLVLAVGRTMSAMILSAVLAALGFGALNPALQTMCIRSVPQEKRGVASNTQFFGMDLGYFLGPAIGGAIYAVSDYSTMFLVTGIIPLALTLAIFLLTWRRVRERLY